MCIYIIVYTDMQSFYKIRPFLVKMGCFCISRNLWNISMMVMNMGGWHDTGYTLFRIVSFHQVDHKKDLPGSLTTGANFSSAASKGLTNKHGSLHRCIWHLLNPITLLLPFIPFHFPWYVDIFPISKWRFYTQWFVFGWLAPWDVQEIPGIALRNSLHLFVLCRH